MHAEKKKNWKWRKREAEKKTEIICNSTFIGAEML